MMKSNNNTSFFVSVLCIFMVFLLCFSVITGAGNNYDSVIGQLRSYAVSFLTINSFFPNFAEKVHFGDCVVYEDSGVPHYYCIFSYPGSCFFLDMTPTGEPEKSTTYAACFLKKYDSSGNSYFDFLCFYEKHDGFHYRNIFGFKVSESEFLRSNIGYPILLSDSEVKELQLYSASFDGSTFTLNSKYGRRSITYDQIYNNNFAGGR